MSGKHTLRMPESASVTPETRFHNIGNWALLRYPEGGGIKPSKMDLQAFLGCPIERIEALIHDEQTKMLLRRLVGLKERHKASRIPPINRYIENLTTCDDLFSSHNISLNNDYEFILRKIIADTSYEVFRTGFT